MKSIWNGAISFGLVNIPIRLYSAIEPKTFKTKLLHKKKLSPIHYKRWCEDCEQEVPWEDVVKGVEVKKNEFVVLTKEELAAVKPEKNQRIEIVEFVDLHQPDPIYFNAHYYVGPDTAKEKSYFLFKEILMQTAKVAIGRFVMREKEYVCAIESYKSGLLLTTLSYNYEIRNINSIEELQEKPKLSPQEIKLAELLIDKIYVKRFDMDKFTDTFATELKKIIDKKQKGKTITLEKKELPVAKEENLIAALKASLK